MAAAVRQELGLGDQALNVWKVIRERGAAIARPDFGPDGPDGLYVWKRGVEGPALITVNRGKDWAQQHFTAAHELGHHEMHRDGPAGLIADASIFGNTADIREEEANAFAGYLLAPDEGLRRLLGDRRNEAVEPESVAEAAAQFGLSYQAALFRIHNANLIRAVDRDRLAGGGGQPVGVLLDAAGARVDAWPGPESDIPAELEAWALALYRRAVITEERLADIIHRSVEEAQALIRDRGMERSEPEPDEAAVLALLSDE